MEIWKNIEGFEGYQISNLGRVKSFKRTKERILKGSITGGYIQVEIDKKLKSIHQLVAIAFLNHKPCGHKLVVNHIDHNKLNNKVENLEIVNQRENANRKHLKSTSKYTGVYWNKRAKKWHSQIIINKKVVYLGLFESEKEAAEVYRNKLSLL